VPYVRRPIKPITDHESDWPIWQVLDQRFVDHRPETALAIVRERGTDALTLGVLAEEAGGPDCNRWLCAWSARNVPAANLTAIHCAACAHARRVLRLRRRWSLARRDR
jgi:hypothetical protein